MALLPVEILLLTLSFEPLALASTNEWAGVLLGRSSILLRTLIAVTGTLLLVLSPRAAELRARFGADSRAHALGWLALNLILYCGFFQYTGWLFGGVPGGLADWYIAAWAALCLAVGVSWCLALAPATVWKEFLSGERAALWISLLAGILVWVFGILTQRFWRPLAAATLFFAHGMVRSFYGEVEYDAAAGTLGTDRLLIEIAPQCSGYEGLALVTVFVAVYLWLFRRSLRFPQAFWLLPVGLAAMWIANVVRIASLVAVGTSISPEIAVQGFHSQAGWIAFTAVALGMIWVSHRSGLVIRAPRIAGESSARARSLLVPFIVLLVTTMTTAAFIDDFDDLYPIGVVMTAATLLRYRRSYRGLPIGVSATSVGIGLAVFLIWIALEWSGPGFHGGREGTLRSGPPAAISGLWIAFRFLGSVVTVPLAEELAFRGYLLRKLVAADFEGVPPTRFTWLSFLGSSVLFGLMHQGWLAGTLAGAGFAMAVYHRGRVTDAVIAHMTANALIALAAIGLGWWGLWL